MENKDFYDSIGVDKPVRTNEGILGPTEEQNQEYFVDFEDLLRRINNLENVVLQLLNPEFMYRRPGSEDYEKITDTLDYLHNKVKELEGK